MNTSDEKISVIDANVLIDFCNTDTSPLYLFSKYISSLIIPLQVFEEVNQLSSNKAKRLLIEIYEPTDDQVFESLDLHLQYKSNTIPDFLSYVFAKDNECDLITNDTRLLKYCHNTQVNTKRGLRLLLDLFEKNYLSKADAKIMAKNIVDSNPQMKIDLYDEFQILIETM